MVTKNNTYIGVREADGIVKMTEAKFNNLVKETVEQNQKIDQVNAAHPDDAPLAHKPAPVAERQQTYGKHEAQTLADAQSLVPDEKVLLTYFNRGYGLAEEKFISDNLTDDDFAATEGVFDLTESMRTLPERTRATRKAQTPADLIASIAAMKGQFTPEQINELINAFATV